MGGIYWKSDTSEKIVMFAKSRQDTLYIIHTEYNWGICEQEIQEIHKNKTKTRTGKTTT